MRINQYLARSGISSRRKSETLILDGKVQLNGQPVSDLATEVNPVTDLVTVEGKEIRLPEKKYYLLNKPTGYVTTKADPYAFHTILELLPNDPSLFPVGRLDRDTAGLIIVTNDGDFAQRIIHPSQKVEKEYIVRTREPLTQSQLEELTRGIELDDGLAKAKSLKKISEKEIVMVIEMGRNRIVRRMVAGLGNKVTGLKRTRIGTLRLDVESGKYRELSREELKAYA